MRQIRHLLILRTVLSIVFGLLIVTGTWDQAAEPTPPAPQTTAIFVSAINEPMHVMGSDGMEHIEYDLIITNAFNAPITLTSIEVNTPDGRQLLKMAGEDLKQNLQLLLGEEPTGEIPASGSVAAVIDVIVPPGKIPQRITHRIAYDIAPGNPLSSVIGTREINGPELTVSDRQPVVISSPLRGTGWVNANGCCLASNHRSFRLVTDGTRYLKPEAFAIDWIQARDNRLFEGNG